MKKEHKLEVEANRDAGTFRADQVDIVALAMMRFVLGITDNKWRYVLFAGNLNPGDFSLDRMKQISKQLESKIDATMLQTDTINAAGAVPTHYAYYDIHQLFEDAIEAEEPIDEDVIVKADIDGAIMFKEDTVERSKKQESGTMQLVYDSKKTSTLKSPYNVYQFLVANGEETYSNMSNWFSQSKFHDHLSELNNLKTYEYKDKVYKPIVILVVDMVCLCLLLGLYAVYKTVSNFRCVWCMIKKVDMARILVPAIQPDGVLPRVIPLEKPTGPARTNGGYNNAPLITCIPTSHMVPDLLHVLVAVIRTYVKNHFKWLETWLKIEVDGNRVGKRVKERLLGVMARLGPKIPVISTKHSASKPSSLVARWEATRVKFQVAIDITLRRNDMFNLEDLLAGENEELKNNTSNT
ncbi:hypothetical protein SAMD00019534_125500 [Acytostelium subglobosum LB1]|uniref:hypothetical protein n=1 Tax=Acytostelium subglobosum LB1 TaxID=1410327 RepID=UPI000644EC6D|nr:hypothetical protein SAMD00019534_125500 [Acytostelium subglobosum LB1]GAM29374.1 hypothetical protein SAMD00019534_125500 [Acytostelium subglobosum LB1]|eukprot:XP_012747679.1 hypothetical protein SAMD00019534_125500 [Acytostelium subglobosum LB1]